MARRAVPPSSVPPRQVPRGSTRRAAGRYDRALMASHPLRSCVAFAATTLLAVAAASQCTPPARLDSTPGLNAGAFVGAPSLDPGPADYFDVEVDAGLTITRLGIVYVDGALGAP